MQYRQQLPPHEVKAISPSVHVHILNPKDVFIHFTIFMLKFIVKIKFWLRLTQQNS
jgi:hypothetical protein